MATINFYLKEPTAETETLIYLVYYCDAFRLKISTGEKIHPNQWSGTKQRANKKYTGYKDFNDFLDTVEGEAKRIPRATLTNEKRTVSSDELKEGLLLFLGKEHKGDELEFFEAMETYLETKKGKLSTNYLKSVKTLKNHLQAFEKSKRYKLTFQRVNLQFYELFTSYLYNNVKQTNNTVGTNISRLKHFLKWSGKMGYNKFTDYKDSDFKAVETETEITYLTRDELYHLLDFPLSPESKLYKVRESFCFACFTGLRFSDVSKISAVNVRGDELILKTQKTQDNLTVPLNDDAISILERNNFKLYAISNQKTNDYLKELAKLAELNDDVKTTRFKGAERIEAIRPKHELITTHTARRTYVTLSLEGGMRPETVMEITGHKNYKNFKRYIKLTDKVKKLEHKRVWNRTREPKLRAV